MSDRERLRREDPVRTAAYRDWAGLWRRPDSWESRDRAAASAEGAGGRADDSWNDVVTRGVELGYRVIDEQIRQGQRVAEQINDRSYDAKTMGGDVQELAERLVKYSSDAWGLWFDFLGALAGGSDWTRNLNRAWQPWTAPSPAVPAEKTTVAIEVLSARPARVTLELPPKSGGRALAVLELRSVDAAKPPLVEIELDGAVDGEVVSLRIRVPDDQPPGVYSGVVVDRDSGEPRGTLSVRIAE